MVLKWSEHKGQERACVSSRKQKTKSHKPSKQGSPEIYLLYRSLGVYSNLSDKSKCFTANIPTISPDSSADIRSLPARLLQATFYYYCCCVPRTSVLNSQPIILRLHVYNTRSRCLHIHTYHTGRDLLCCYSRLQRKCVTHDATDITEVSSNDAYLRHDPSIK